MANDRPEPESRCCHFWKSWRSTHQLCCSNLLWIAGVSSLIAIASVLSAAKILNQDCTTKVEFSSQKIILLTTYTIVIAALIFCSIAYILNWENGKLCARKFSVHVTLHSTVEILALTTFAFVTITEITLSSYAVHSCLGDKSPVLDIACYACTRGLTVVVSCLFLAQTVFLVSSNTNFVRRLGVFALIIGNGTLWLEAFMISLTEKSLVFNAIETKNNCALQEKVLLCLDSVHNYTKSLRPILIPFLTEYSLSALLIGIHSLGSNPLSEDDDIISSETDSSSHKEFESKSSQNGLLESQVNCCNYVWILLLSILALMQMLGSAVVLLENEITSNYTEPFTKEDQKKLQKATILTLVPNILGCIWAIAVSVKFRCSDVSSRQSTSQSWKEVVLLLSLSSFFFSWPIQIDFDESCLKPNPSGSLHCHTYSSNFLDTNIAYAVVPAAEATAQFYLLYYLKRIRLPKTWWLKLTLSFFLILNLALWGIDTFYWSEKKLFIQQASKGSTEKQWNFYTTALLSITIFFRYECAVTFFFALAEILRKEETTFSLNITNENPTSFMIKHRGKALKEPVTLDELRAAIEKELGNK